MKIIKKSLTCEKAVDMMFDYIDGELRESDRLRFEAHINECADCKRELDGRTEMLSLLGECELTPPAALKSSVMSRIENTPQDAKVLYGSHRFIKVGTVAAAAAVMILLVGKGFIFGGGMNDVAQDAENVIALTDNSGMIPEYSDDADAVPSDALYAMTADKSGISADVKTDHIADDAEETEEAAVTTLYATTTALKAASPGYGLILQPSVGAAAEKSAETPSDVVINYTAAAAPASATVSPIDALFEKIRTKGSAVLVCMDGVITLPDAAYVEEAIIYNGCEFRHITVTSDAAEIFTGILSELEASGTHYRTAVPEGSFVKVDIFIEILSEGAEE